MTLDEVLATISLIENQPESHFKEKVYDAGLQAQKLNSEKHGAVVYGSGGWNRYLLLCYGGTYHLKLSNYHLPHWGDEYRNRAEMLRIPLY